MKTINDYTIYCTRNQTKKAFKLGAELMTFGYPDLGSKEEAVLKLNRQVVLSRKDDNSIIVGQIPTAEEMIGWLEDFDCIKEITICKTGMWIWGKNHTLIDSGSSYSSRRESSHAAIDAALDYLIHYKNDK